MRSDNKQKAQTAAARLAKLPVVRWACTKLSVLYIDTKCSHPQLRSVCDVLESSVTAVVSPVIVKLEPQISIANGLACRSLDWLETAFPVIHTPTEQIVASARNKMHEIQDVVSVAAYGTMGCVEHTVAWVTGSRRQADGQSRQSLVERAVSVASLGLDSTLVTSEALMDRMLPAIEEDEEEEVHLVEGFEAATLVRRCPVRLVSLAAQVCWRTYRMVGSKMQLAQVMENLFRSIAVVQETSWLTLTWSIPSLPQYLQHQLVSASFFISQMYSLSCPAPKHHRSYQDRSSLNTAASRRQKAMVQVHPQAKPFCRVRRLTKIPAFDNECDVKGCVR
ncbi:perilipin-2-like [Clinocottus analis]|uniref:perilipin-2-like n=1 Tax=Clinocottus analis TaxID=304258 RepID=UPI0035C149C1